MVFIHSVPLYSLSLYKNEPTGKNNNIRMVIKYSLDLSRKMGIDIQKIGHSNPDNRIKNEK